MYLSDKESFWKFLVRKGYLMPSLKSTIISLDFCDKVFRKVIRLPSWVLCRPAMVAEPPEKKVLKQMLIENLLEHHQDQ